MTTNTTFSAKQYGRIAGLLYLIIIITGLFSELFVRGTLIVPNDAAATAQNIMAAPMLYRIGFLSDFIMVLCDIGVAIIFYQLLRPVSHLLALTAMLLRLAQAIIIGYNLLHYFSVLLILDSTSATGADVQQLYTQAMLQLQLHHYGYLISGIFFGVCCLLLGYLFYRSAYFTKVLGIMISLAGVGYLVDCFTNFLAPSYADLSEILLLFTAVITELTLCLWLIIKGAKTIAPSQLHD
ncbi:MAG: DUF4386 domain-containing protein [Flavipsychrobacter sp.]